MPLRRFQRQYEQLSQFERGRIISMMEAGWSARRIAHQLGRSDCVPTALSAAIQAQVAPSLGPLCLLKPFEKTQNTEGQCPNCPSITEGHLGSRHPLHMLPLMPTHRRLHLELCSAQGNWTAVEWNQVVFSDESRFNLGNDDNHARV
ncbi:transposable element Tcb2 transposase [Trichonephila clavipes]|uniref:Transposable element Tcb2 transposase n=1 Tax=Trichonephila clavipes TaxID=2585209 RepID=A0A8X6R4K5_TRICX|nr:transposable element Tcb2 transposase [Trichonephila clavipes]